MELPVNSVFTTGSGANLSKPRKIFPFLGISGRTAAYKVHRIDDCSSVPRNMKTWEASASLSFLGYISKRILRIMRWR